MADYYSVLNVDRSATHSEIKKSFRLLSKLHHPDKTKSNSHDKYVEITEAYEVLRDDDKRRIYDRYGKDGLKNEVRNQHHFRQERKSIKVEIPIQVTLEELYDGGSVDINVSKQILCPSCRGSGAKSPQHYHVCSKCQGNGFEIQRQQFAPGIYQQIQTQCTKCNGNGRVISQTCDTCKGTKFQRGGRQLTVYIERGMNDGEKIVFEGEGDQYEDTTASDFIFILEQIPHSHYVRRGMNLYLRHTLTLQQALLGFTIELKHLDASVVVIERSGVTQNGFVLNINDKGMRDIYGEPRGDLYVEFDVVFPVVYREIEWIGISKFDSSFEVFRHLNLQNIYP